MTGRASASVGWPARWSVLGKMPIFALLAVLVVLLLGGSWLLLTAGHKIRIADPDTGGTYANPLPRPDGPLAVYHLGHSLVGRDMPAMLQQMSGGGHGYAVQLGWGTPLRAHWEPGVGIAGFESENDHEKYRDAGQALQSGSYDVFIATEMVEIRDAIAYHAAPDYLGRWSALAREGNPNMRVYLYETWPRTDDAERWLDRLDRDLSRHWETEILLDPRRLNRDAAPIYVIPAGQALAAFVRELEARGGIDNIADRYALFAQQADGTPDRIHLGDLGVYLVALTHYATLYHQSPVGLPRQLLRADGSAAIAPGENAARLMQEIVWKVVTSYPKTGVRQRD